MSSSCSASVGASFFAGLVEAADAAFAAGSVADSAAGSLAALDSP